MQTTKRQKRKRRQQRTRARIKSTSYRPRVSVFRSNKHVWVQLIDDLNGRTLASASDFELLKLSSSGKKSRNPAVRAKNVGTKSIATEVGELIAKKAAALNVHSAVFDRGGYKYHGLVKMIAEGIRKGGLKI